MKFNQVLGLNFDEDEAPEEVKALAQKRWEAKKARDFATADSLRTQISTLGYEIKDAKDGYKILKK